MLRPGFLYNIYITFRRKTTSQRSDFKFHVYTIIRLQILHLHSNSFKDHSNTLGERAILSLFLCLHLEINSFLLFSRWRVSAFIMYNFSVRHRSHLFDPQKKRVNF